VATALYLDYFGYTPLCAYDWSHETTLGALARNREGIAKFVRLTYNERTKAYAREAGLKIDLVCFPSSHISRRSQKSSTSKTLCYLRSFNTRGRFMMATVGPNRIFPGTD
jgi:hypothetical protein